MKDYRNNGLMKGIGVIVIELLLSTQLFNGISLADFDSYTELSYRRIRTVSTEIQISLSGSITEVADVVALESEIIEVYESLVTENTEDYNKMAVLINILSTAGCNDLTIFEDNPAVWEDLARKTYLQGTADEAQFIEGVSHVRNIRESADFNEFIAGADSERLASTVAMLEEFAAQGWTNYSMLGRDEVTALTLAVATDVLGEDGDWYRFSSIVTPWNVVDGTSINGAAEEESLSLLGRAGQWFKENRLNIFTWVRNITAALLTYGWVIGSDLVATSGIGTAVTVAAAFPLFFGVRGFIDLAGLWGASLFQNSATLERDSTIQEMGIPDNRRTAILYSAFCGSESDVIEIATKMRLSLSRNDEKNVVATFLSDSANPDVVRREVEEVLKLQEEFGKDRVFYFHRGQGFGKKWGSYQDLGLFLRTGNSTPSTYTDPKWDYRKKLTDSDGAVLGVDLGNGFYIDTVNHTVLNSGVFTDANGDAIQVNGQDLTEADVTFASTYCISYEGGEQVLRDINGDIVKVGKELFNQTAARGNFTIDYEKGVINIVRANGEIIPLKFDILAQQGISNSDQYELHFKGEEQTILISSADIEGQVGGFLIYNPNADSENLSDRLVRYNGRYLVGHAQGMNYRRNGGSEIFSLARFSSALEGLISEEEMVSGMLGDIDSLHIGDTDGRAISYFAIADQDNTYTEGSIREIIAAAAANPEYAIFQPFLEQSNTSDSAYAKWSGALPQSLLRFTGIGNMVLGAGQFMGKGVIDIQSYIDAMMQSPEEALKPYTRCHDFIESISLLTAFMHDVSMGEDAPGGWFVELNRAKGWRVGDWIGIVDEWLPHTTMGRLYSQIFGDGTDPGSLPDSGRRIMEFVLTANLMPIGFAGFLMANYAGAIMPGILKPGDPIFHIALLIASAIGVVAIPSFIGAITNRLQNDGYSSNPAVKAGQVAGDLGRGLANFFISTSTLMQSLYDQPGHVISAIRDVYGLKQGEAMVWKPMASLASGVPSTLGEAISSRSGPITLALGLIAAALVSESVYSTSGFTWLAWASPILFSFIAGPVIAYYTGRSRRAIKDASFEVERGSEQYNIVGDALLAASGNDLEQKAQLLNNMYKNINPAPVLSSYLAGHEHTSIIGDQEATWSKLSQEQQTTVIAELSTGLGREISEDTAKELLHSYLNSILEVKLAADDTAAEKAEKDAAKLADMEAMGPDIQFAQAIYSAIYWVQEGGFGHGDNSYVTPEQGVENLYNMYNLDGLTLSDGRVVTIELFRQEVSNQWTQVIFDSAIYDVMESVDPNEISG
ncbi:MAG: hypothetical protein P9M06_03860, partial [Candidatus Saelkia tenebricola]|nr:hypothetical protein [Candidatus Saelkia tenebricola]